MIKQNDKLTIQNKKANKRLKQILKISHELKNQNDNISYKLDSVCDDRVIPTGKTKDIGHLILIKNNIDLDDYDDDEYVYEYTVLRIIQNNLNKLYTNHKIEYPNCKILKNMKILYNAQKYKE